MKTYFNSLEELQERHEKTYANKESKTNIENMLNKEIRVYYDENYFVYNEANELIGYLKEY